MKNNNYHVSIHYKETHEKVKTLGLRLDKEQANQIANKHNLNLNNARYYIKVYKSITLDEFVELCLCNWYKNMSVDFENKSVSVLVGDKRVEASELGYEVKFYSRCICHRLFLFCIICLCDITSMVYVSQQNQSIYGIYIFILWDRLSYKY